MPICFVIQPFDGGAFDKRYNDTLEPAIRKAEIDPYRVDRDVASVIPIADIEKGIKNSDVCLAEISTDNPNVWFEVGFAISAGKHVVLVCSQERQKFPFDVQHRTIIRYKTESKSDFEELAKKVTARLKSAIQQKNEIATIAELSPIANTEGLSEHEIVALVLIAENIDGPLSAHFLSRGMSSAGYTNIAASLSLRALINKNFVEAGTGQDNNNGEPYSVFSPTVAGFRWLEMNQNKLVLRKRPKLDSPLPGPGRPDEDIPF